MEETRFDTLLRAAAGHTTRRAALGALVGGALLLGAPGVGEATKEGKRRKARKRRQRKGSGCCGLRPISLWVVNGHTKAITVQQGEFSGKVFVDCLRQKTVTIQPGQKLRFASNTNVQYVLINDLYGFTFENWALAPPYVAAAAAGVPLPGLTSESTCPTRGRHLGLTELDEGQRAQVDILSTRWFADRTRDTNYKEFRLLVPPGIKD